MTVGGIRSQALLRAVGGFAFAAWLLPASAVWAVQPDEILSDRVLEARARTISETLRCLVCQNQSIDDSDAPLARDLRLLVRERIKAGDADADVRAFVVGRYGEFVLLRPVFAWHTALLWIGPFLVLAGGIAGLVVARRRLPAAEAPLDDDQRAELAALGEREITRP